MLQINLKSREERLKITFLLILLGILSIILNLGVLTWVLGVIYGYWTSYIALNYSNGLLGKLLKVEKENGTN